MAQKGSNRKLVVDFLHDNPNVVWSDLQISQATGLTAVQVYDALFFPSKVPENNIERIGSKSWRHVPPNQNRKVILTITKPNANGSFEAVDQFGASYLVKPL